MKFSHPVLFAVSISLMALTGSAMAADSDADQAMSKCQAAASDEGIPGTELTSFLRQCMADAGVSQSDIESRTGQGGPSEGGSQAAESTD